MPHRDPVIVPTHYGDFLAPPDDVITRQLQHLGGHTRPELAMLLSFVRPGDTVLDIGAHIGTFAIPMARAGARVIAFEPDATSAKFLEINARRNGLTIDLRHVGVGDKTARCSILHSHANTGGAVLAADENGVVETIRLDEALPADLSIDLVKIDVEGMELAVLRGASQLLRRCRPILYLEVGARQLERHGGSLRQMRDFLRALGYRHLYVNAGPRNADHDNFQLASLPSLYLLSRGLHDVLAVHAASPRRPERAHLTAWTAFLPNAVLGWARMALPHTRATGQA